MHSAFIWCFFSIKGRICRQEFRLGIFGLALIDMLVVRMGVKLTALEPRYYDVNPFPGVSVLHTLLVVSLWPLAALLVKRLHDLNLSGRWALAILTFPQLTHVLGIKYWIPYLLVAATLSALPGWHGKNRFGSDPSLGI